MAGLLLEVAATAAHRIHFAKAKCLQESTSRGFDSSLWLQNSPHLKNMNKKIIVSALLCSSLVFYFSGVGFNFSFLGQAISAIVMFALLCLAGRGGWQRFYLVALSTFSSGLSLGCSFLSPSEVSGPFITSIRLNPFIIVMTQKKYIAIACPDS